jgi:hypothetical protein
VRALGETVPFGWGYARTPQTKIDQDYLDIDADASTVITRQDGDIGKVSYLKDDVVNAAFFDQPPQDVAVIGVGGGRDVLSALLFGARRARTGFPSAAAPWPRRRRDGFCRKRQARYARRRRKPA